MLESYHCCTLAVIVNKHIPIYIHPPSQWGSQGRESASGSDHNTPNQYNFPLRPIYWMLSCYLLTYIFPPKCLPTLPNPSTQTVFHLGLHISPLLSSIENPPTTIGLPARAGKHKMLAICKCDTQLMFYRRPTIDEVTPLAAEHILCVSVNMDYFTRCQNRSLTCINLIVIYSCKKTFVNG